MSTIIDDKYDTIENDIEKIQTKPTMYISHVGSKAFLHLIKEMVNNVLDEYDNENNISNKEFTLLYDKLENMIYVEDNGRGIPFEELMNACTILHSGTKMRREHGKTAGENGVGLTATNALSEVFEITSYRNGQMRMLQFREGKNTLDTTTSIKNKDKHGLLVGFKPSTLFLGKCQLNPEELDLWLRKLMYIKDDKDIKVKFIIRENGKDVEDTRVYQNTKGIGGFLQELEPESNLLKTPVILTSKSQIMESNIPVRSEDGSINLIDIERDINLTVVINYKEDSQDTIKYSFCNDIENIEHGEHTNAVVNAIVTFLRKKAKEEIKKDDIDVINNDVLYGLTVLTVLNTDYSTGLFTSQTKHKMDNHDFYEPIRKMTMEALENFFKFPENKKILNAIIGVIRTNINARLAATKARKSSKKQKSFLESSVIAGYYPPNMIDASEKENPHGCELYIVEGDSAGSNARIGRYNPDIQGVLGLGGKPSNGWKIPENSNVEKIAPDIAMFFNDVLGCGMGKNFHIEDCRYKRIIISTDADIDGDHICGITVANIYKYARPLIEAGMVYRVITPLYMLRPKKESKKIDRSLYLYSKDEFFTAYEKRASEVYKIKIDLNDNFVSNAAMRRFLKTNRDYYQAIDVACKQNTTHPDIIEYLAYHINDYRTNISKDFDELSYSAKDNSIKGIYDKSFQAFIIDDTLEKTLHYLHEVIMIGNEGHYQYHLYKKTSNPEPAYLGYQTIYNIMNYCQEQEPEIESRFKGQGELNANEFNTLAMNPYNRNLLRITVYDVESALETILNLFDDSRTTARKQLVANADISIEDIDN